MRVGAAWWGQSAGRRRRTDSSFPNLTAVQPGSRTEEERGKSPGWLPARVLLEEERQQSG